MRKIFITLVAMASLLLAASGVQAQYVETFDTGSANWNYGYGTSFALGTTNWMSTGGNPDGHISGTSDNLYAIWTYDTASYGDMTGLIMTIDTMVTNAETGNAQFYVGRGNTFYINGIWDVGADTSWTTHTVALDSSNFTRWTQGGAGSESLAYVLAAPDDIGIFFGGNVAAGTGNISVDNFGTVVVPEPISSTLFIVGGATLGFRRFRKKFKK